MTKEGVLVQSSPARCSTSRSGLRRSSGSTRHSPSAARSGPARRARQRDGPGHEPGRGPGSPDPGRAGFTVDSELVGVALPGTDTTPGADGPGGQPAARPARRRAAVLDDARRRDRPPGGRGGAERSEMQFRVAMENAPIGMALVDVEWRIVEANAAFAELLGTSVGALRGYRMEDLSTPKAGPPSASRSTVCWAADSTGSPSRSGTSGPTVTRCGPALDAALGARRRPARRTTSSSRCG